MSVIFFFTASNFSVTGEKKKRTFMNHVIAENLTYSLVICVVKHLYGGFKNGICRNKRE